MLDIPKPDQEEGVLTPLSQDELSLRLGLETPASLANKESAKQARRLEIRKRFGDVAVSVARIPEELGTAHRVDQNGVVMTPTEERELTK